MKRKKLNSACTLDSFRRGLTARHTIDIDPPFQFVDLCSGVTGSCPVAPKKMSRRTVKLNDTEVIIIISKPRRRLTHTWNPFFVLLGMRKGQRKHTNTPTYNTYTHKWEESQTRSAALKAPFFQRLDSSVCVKKFHVVLLDFCIFCLKLQQLHTTESISSFVLPNFT